MCAVFRYRLWLALPRGWEHEVVEAERPYQHRHGKEVQGADEGGWDNGHAALRPILDRHTPDASRGRGCPHAERERTRQRVTVHSGQVMPAHRVRAVRQVSQTYAGAHAIRLLDAKVSGVNPIAVRVVHLDAAETSLERLREP